MDKTIGENIKKLRKKHKMSQAEFGRIANVTDKAVSAWENGAKYPRVECIRKITEYFNVPSSVIISSGTEKQGFVPVAAYNGGVAEIDEKQKLKNDICRVIQDNEFDENVLKQIKSIVNTFM